MGGAGDIGIDDLVGLGTPAAAGGGCDGVDLGWFIFFPDVAAGDEGGVGDFLVDLFDIDAGGALFDFFDEEVDAAVVGVGHGVSALIEEDLDEA